MSDLLGHTASAVRDAAEVLRDGARSMVSQDPGPGAFGGHGPGRLGALGREMHAQLARALDARASEATRHAGRLDAMADHVARAAHGYAEVDESARRATGPVA